MSIEKLTDEDRAWLRNDTRATGPKALLIIDAHAADRAELVAQLAGLTRERDEALKVKEWQLFEHKAQRLESAVTRLTEALAAAKSVGSAQVHAHFDSVYARAEAAEARVRELEALLAKGSA